MRTRGHPDVFNAQQNAALRSALRGLRDTQDQSQASLGALLGVSQQTAGKLLRSQSAGFSYAVATRLVQVLGHAGVDAFFAAKGIGLRPSRPPRGRAA